MMTHRELAERGGEIDYSAVAQAVRRLTRRIQENAGLDRAFRILQKEIAQMSKSRSDPILHPSLWNKRRLTVQRRLFSREEPNFPRAGVSKFARALDSF